MGPNLGKLSKCVFVPNLLSSARPDGSPKEVCLHAASTDLILGGQNVQKKALYDRNR